MTDKPTLKEVCDALDEMEVLMGISTGNPGVVETLTAIYAKAYCMKLRLMPKENPHANH